MKQFLNATLCNQSKVIRLVVDTHQRNSIFVDKIITQHCHMLNAYTGIKMLPMLTKACNQKNKQGFSLFELLIALSIFTVVAVPMLSLPLKAQDVQKKAENTTVSNFEVNNMFSSSLGKEIRNASHFLPLQSNALNSDYNYKKLLVVSHYDSATRKEKRTAFSIGKNSNDKPALFSMEVPASASLAYFRLTNNPNWKKIALLDDKDKSYLEKTSTNGELCFIYCIDNNCDGSNRPEISNGVIFADTKASPQQDPIRPFLYKYNDQAIEMPPLYFKLSSAKGSSTDDDSIMPLSVATSQTISGIPSNTIASDIHFNNRTQQVLFATQRTISGKAQFEIYKWPLGARNFKGYESFENPDNAPTYTSQDYFPIILKEGDTGYPGDNFFVSSVTQDNQGNIYLLGKQSNNTTKSTVLRFSPSGEYTGQFSPVAISEAGAIAITFNPNTPREIQILSITPDLGLVIESYAKDWSSPNGQRPRANRTAISQNIMPLIKDTNTDPSTISGFEYAPSIDSYLISFKEGKVISISPQTNTERETEKNNLSPFKRMGYVQSIWKKENLLNGGSPYDSDFWGLAYDDVHHQMLSIEVDSAVRLIYTKPNVNLHKRI